MSDAGRARRLVSAALLAAAVVAVLPQAKASAAPGNLVSFQADSRPGAVRSFWTKQRIVNTNPLDFERKLSSEEATIPADPQGIPTSLAPTSPTVGRLSATGPIPYSSHEVIDPAVAPYRTNGLVTGVGGNGLRYSCSGTVVTSGNRSVVWTAAHCVYNPDLGGWSRSMLFIPGYEQKTAPYGEWPVTGGVVSTGWTQGFASAYDMAALVVAPNLLGQRIEEVVGGQGLMTGQSPQQSFDAYGYPGRAPFDREHQWVCESAYGGEDPFEPGTMSIGCDMTAGASGGGWIVDDGYLNSVISYGYEGKPEVTYGPYFGSTAATLHQKASTMAVALGPIGAPNFGDDSVQAAPVPTPSRLTHAMTVSLNLWGHLRAGGRMTAADGYEACTRHARIRIFVRDRARWELVRRTTTNGGGRFLVRIPDRPGTYKAFAPGGSVDDLNSCAESTSSTRRHRR